jgi:hypothetical protein
MNRYVVKIPDTVDRYDKSFKQIAEERNTLLNNKRKEIQDKIDAYIEAQNYQKENGGPGPTADFDIIKIVNEYNGQFIVAWT